MGNKASSDIGLVEKGVRPCNSFALKIVKKKMSECILIFCEVQSKTRKMENYQEFISVDPNIRFGKPCIKGTRIAVLDILQFLASGMTYEEVIADYPALTKDHILAALAFAAKREQISKIIAA